MPARSRSHAGIGCDSFERLPFRVSKFILRHEDVALPAAMDDGRRQHSATGILRIIYLRLISDFLLLVAAGGNHRDAQGQGIGESHPQPSPQRILLVLAALANSDSFGSL